MRILVFRVSCELNWYLVSIFAENLDYKEKRIVKNR
jgi:hypothetical protein